jgi:hypothetical protein
MRAPFQLTGAKSALAALGARPEGRAGLHFGAGVYHDRVTPDHEPKTKELALTPGTPGRDFALDKICRFSDPEFARHFHWATFAGKIQPAPQEPNTPASARTFVAYLPGAIGYRLTGGADDTVRVLPIYGLLPGDSGSAPTVPGN